MGGSLGMGVSGMEVWELESWGWEWESGNRSLWEWESGNGRLKLGECVLYAPSCLSSDFVVIIHLTVF